MFFAWNFYDLNVQFVICFVLIIVGKSSVVLAVVIVKLAIEFYMRTLCFLCLC